MKLADLKQGLIQKFFKQVEDGVAFERCSGVYKRLRDHLASPRATALLEGQRFKEHENATKAFREFDSSPVGALEAVSPDGKVYFLAGKSGRKSYACVEVTNPDAEPRGCTAVSIKQSLLEIRDEFGEEVMYRVRTPSSVLKEVIYIRDAKRGVTGKIKAALEKVHSTFTNAGFNIKPEPDTTVRTLARHSFGNEADIGKHRLVLEVQAIHGVIKHIRLSDIEIDRNQRSAELSGSTKVEISKPSGQLYSLHMDLDPASDKKSVNMNVSWQSLTEDELVKELRSAWTKFRPYYEKLKKIRS